MARAAMIYPSTQENHAYTPPHDAECHPSSPLAAGFPNGYRPDAHGGATVTAIKPPGGPGGIGTPSAPEAPSETSRTAGGRLRDRGGCASTPATDASPSG